MSGIHQVVMDKLVAELQRVMIDDLIEDDPTRAGKIMLGPLQGNPDPDVARISITVHENDPDYIVGGSGPAKIWDDEPIEQEMGAGHITTTWSRKFSVKARCLLESSREELVPARVIASVVRSRIEKCIREIDFAGVETSDEYVSMGAVSENRRGETLQSGGPPDAYDFHIKIKFEIWTTEK
jgi:hypothetical protein